MALWNDLRFALRQIRKAPAFTLTVLLTLALCIGVNTAIFSVLDAVLFRPAPFPEPDRLALLVTATRGQSGEFINTSQTGALYEAVRDRANTIECAAWSDFGGGVNFAAQGKAEYVQQARVSTGYFRVMGIPPMIGREFTRQEDVAGGPPVAILNYAFWQRAFHGNPAVVGAAITLKGEPYTVVGVMPPEFRSRKPVDVWTPLRPSRTGEGGGSNYGVVARLRPGISWQAASEQLKALSANLRDDPAFPREANDFEERIAPLQAAFAEESRRELNVTWGAVLLVLLIGCVNIAGLLLARSGARAREVATRMALGGSRAVIVRQLLMESLLLAVGGGILGLAIGGFALDLLKQLGADQHQLWQPIELDGRVLIVMAGVALLTSLIFGLAPALATTRVDLRAALVEGGRGIAGPRRSWSRQAMVAAEIALSLVLLVGAGLMVRTLAYLNGLAPGFDTRNVIAVEASLQDARYEKPADLNRFYAATLERIRGIAGVQSAAVALTLPYERPLNNGVQLAEGDDRKWHMAEWVYATPGYFETMRIPVIDGRTFRDSDTAESAPVVVVSKAFAARYFPKGDAVGHHLAGKTPREIVGVAGDVQVHSGFGNGGPIAIEPTVYQPATQLTGSLKTLHTWFSPKWVIRTNGPSSSINQQVQRAIASVDPLLPIAQFHTVDELAGRYIKSERYMAALFSMLAGLALLLAAIGLYGLISHSIAQRRQELGIRIALGATVQQTMVAVMRPGLVLAFAGASAGLGLSVLAVRLMKSLIFGVRETDPATFIVTAAILLAVAFAASLGSALRLLKLDPVRTLRGE